MQVYLLETIACGEHGHAVSFRTIVRTQTSRIYFVGTMPMEECMGERNTV